MIPFVIKRFLQTIPVLIGISVLAFLLLHLIPGDPIEAVLGPEASPEAIERTRVELGLDKPLHVQFILFFKNAIKGDLGTSVRTGNSVSSLIAQRYPYTCLIALGATFLAATLGMLAGIISAVNQNRWGDNVTMVLSLLAVSTPSFWLGLMLMLIFSLYLRLLPSIGIHTPLHFILPTITLGAQSTGLIARMTRSAMLDVLRQDYIRTAKAKGLSERAIIYGHALKNALIPVITVVGLRFGGLLAGTVLVESIFAIPGIGRLMVESVLMRDYPVVQGTLLVISTSFVIINTLVDILYKLVDPRVRITNE